MEISNLCANQYYGELLREAGAIESVIEAVLRFPNSLRVQFAAVQAIANLSAGSNQARLRLGAAGAGRVLVQCLVRFSQDQVRRTRGGVGSGGVGIELEWSGSIPLT